MYVCIYAYLCLHPNTCIDIYIFVFTYQYIYIYTHRNKIYTCLYIYIYIYIIWREICITHIISYQYYISGIIYHTSAYIHNICLYIYTHLKTKTNVDTHHTHITLYIYICVFLSTYISYTSSIEPHIPKSKWSWPQDFAMFAHSKHWTGSK